MASHLHQLSGLPVSIVPIAMGEWPAVVRRTGWVRLMRKLDETISQMITETGCHKILIVAHSLGGVVTRLYLSNPSEFDFPPRHAKAIDCVITLGTPHQRGLVHRLTVWKGLSERLQHGRVVVPIYSVAGQVDYSSRSRVLKRLVRLRYRIHGAGSEELGDGIIPCQSAIYDKQRAWTLEDVRHDFRIGHPWYGDEKIVEDWWGKIARELKP